jgi:hypothetical protein
MSVTAKTGKKQDASRFKKGVSGNPRGRQAGSRNKATILLEKMMADDGKGVVNAVLEAAKGGDMQAARIILDRICPPRKERPISCKLPKLEDASDLVAGISALIGAVANGELTPGEGQALASLIEAQRRTLETEDIEQRLIALEADRSLNR